MLAAGGLWWGRENSVRFRDSNAVPLFVISSKSIFSSAAVAFILIHISTHDPAFGVVCSSVTVSWNLVLFSIKVFSLGFGFGFFPWKVLGVA